ncbi:MAG TPA: sigma-54 dependent transcriptional regulator [Vicinamibacterales bacterium]|jgi:transcriptional regulator with GAF, ATPase, and Fis domain
MSQRISRMPPRDLASHLGDGEPRIGDERLIGGDTGLAAVMSRARLVSRSGAPVLLFGETGTGKEIVARAIHEHSPFRAGVFRRVNCGAIAPELIDSELFGHEQGAFTGATARRKGWFEQADGGTLFLDEIGELSLAAQVRLLRVVQDSEVMRVGGERPVHVHVRIVAATHRDLPAMVERQAFREDLYYRLSVFPIVIPPLRDRPGDVRAFAEYFAERAADRFGLKRIPASDEDVRILSEYQWPGNVREMAAVMDRAVLIGQGRALDVTAALGHAARPTPASAPGPTGAAATTIEPLDVVVSRHIQAAVQTTHGRIEGPHGAARLLRINPHTLRARMRKLKISWSSFRPQKN